MIIFGRLKTLNQVIRNNYFLIHIRISHLVIMILIFGIYISCSGPERDNKDKTVFRYNEAAGITSLDPAFAKNLANIWACNQLFNGLVQLDNNLKVIPCIAKEWEISGDGLTYTFHLRNDIYFHDHPLFYDQKGRKVVAGDFVYSFNRILDPMVTSPGAWVFQNVELRDRQYGFFAPDDSTVIIRLAKPFPPFLGILSMQYCSVIPREVVEYYGKDFRQNPVGTGPFYFKMWKEGVKLVCRRNNHYFEKDLLGNPLPYLEAVSITFLMDKQSAFLEFVKGNLDFMSGLDASYKDELLTKDGELHPKYQDKFQLITEPYLNTEYLGILVDTGSELVRQSPLRFSSVRKAINYGFDREKMIRYLRNNIGIPGNYGIVPSGMPSFDSNFVRGYSYNPDKARHLLASAGFQNGNNLPDITLATTSEYLDLCKFIQHQLSEIGINLKIEVNPPATLKEMKAQAKLGFFRASWIADYPDAENYLSLFYSPNFCPEGPNYTHFFDNRFDEMYEMSQLEVNDSLRYHIYKKMENLLMEASPVVILYYDQVLRFVQKNIYGLGSNPINLLDLRKVRKSEINDD